MLMLFGGAGFGKVMAIVMLWQSLNAFHVTGIPFAQLGAMYVTATTVAGAVPMPGGVGAVEAALTAGLVEPRRRTRSGRGHRRLLPGDQLLAPRPALLARLSPRAEERPRLSDDVLSGSRVRNSRPSNSPELRHSSM